MSKKKRILLTLISMMSIIAIVGIIWLLKYNIQVKQQKEVMYQADQSVLVLSTSVSSQERNEMPQIQPQIIKEQKMINDFASANIHYMFGNQEEVINGDRIKDWIRVEGEEVVLDEEQVKAYVAELSKKYDTVGSERQFVDSHGDAVVVSGGPYGWQIDSAKETKELLELIKQGKTIKNREPVYKQKALIRGVNDIGNTYVEVNMSEQKMWFYKEGELVVSTDIVTGNMAKGHDTPTVVGYIYNKVRNTNLVGTGYVAFVHYWMKVYGSIGIHDASWRTKFGGDIYTTSGSHGCINTPYDNVKKIFDTIEVGTPVIIFYENPKE